MAGYTKSDAARYNNNPKFRELVARAARIQQAVDQTDTFLRAHTKQLNKDLLIAKKLAIKQAGANVNMPKSVPAQIMDMDNPAAMTHAQFVSKVTPHADGTSEYHVEAAPLNAGKLFVVGTSPAQRNNIIAGVIEELERIGVQHNLSICYTAMTGPLTGRVTASNRFYDTDEGVYVIVTNETGTIAWSSMRPKVLVVNAGAVSGSKKLRSPIKRINIWALKSRVLQQQQQFEAIFRQL